MVDVDQIRVVDYKAFAGEARLDVLPLTVIFGPNGSGKSALARLPVLLSAALRPQADDGPGLPWRTRGFEAGSSLLSFCHGGVPTGYEIEVRRGRTRLAVTVDRDPASPSQLPGQRVRSWELHDAQGGVRRVVWDSASRGYQNDGGKVAGFRGLVPYPAQVDLGGLNSVVEHLGPRRDPGDTRLIVVEPRPHYDVGSSGEHTGRVLASFRLFGPETLIDELREAIADLLDIELRLDNVLGGDHTAGYALSARRVGRLSWQPLHELGTGVAHALPVVVQQLAAAKAGDHPPDVLVVEEPESHLHVSVQARLADLFLKTARAGRTRSVVETHSEAFILRLQRRVAEEPALAELISLVFIDDTGAETLARRLPIDRRGEVPGWPEGWFDAALHETLAIQAARRSRA